ncbi:recombinase family protein [Planctomycetaceae bacterium SH139]
MSENLEEQIRENAAGPAKASGDAGSVEQHKLTEQIAADKHLAGKQAVTGTESANRPEFQALLRDAERGRFEAILLHEQSRFSREDIFDVMFHWRLLREAGVDIVTCQRGRLRFDDLGGIITAIIDQHGAREESIKLATRVVSGQRLRASQGKRIGGTLWGYDREMYDDQGKLVKRIGFKERFRKPPTWSSQLVPSEDATVVDSIRWMFEAVRQGHSVGHVCRGLNERGLTTIADKRFSYNTVLGMIRNATYAGRLVAGKTSKAKFCRFDQEGLIIVEDAHEAIVSPDVFDAVQVTLAARKRSHQRGDVGKYMLSGLVRCVHCGNRMHGVHRKERGRPTPQVFYQCGNAPLTPGFDPNCPHPAVRQDRLESFVIGTLRSHLLKTKAADQIKDAIRRAKTKRSKQTTGDERKLASVRQKIERGTENLALADRENFSAISKLLSQWRDEESALLTRIENRAIELAPLPEAIEVIERMGENFANLKSAGRVQLAHAIRLTVDSLTIGTRNATTGGIKHPELFGELTVHSSLAKKPIRIPDEEIGRRKIWREIADLVRQSKTPLHLKDFCNHIGTEDASHAAYHVRRAERAGLIRKVGHQGGWITSHRGGA